MSDRQSTTTTTELRGSVKRTGNGKLVAEVGAHVSGSVKSGDLVSIGSREYTVTGRGRAFDRGYGRDRTTLVYLYLEEAPLPDDAIHLTGCGRNSVAAEGAVIRSPRLDGPRYLVVLRASTRYYAEDAMSFGDTDDCGYVASLACRPATDAEAAPLIAAEQQQQRRREARARRSALGQRIREQGVRPEGRTIPEGETVLSTQTIYGGGDWFVVGPDLIWFVINNGADGDDWSANNVTTGGAGAIGWHVVRTYELIREIEEIAAILGQARV